MKRIIGLVVLILVLAGGWYGYRKVFGKVESLENIKADITLPAAELLAAFEKDTAAANRRFLEKNIETTGRIKSVESEEKSATVVLGEEGSMSSIRCSMDSSHVQGATALKEGSTVTIKGYCTGFNMDELLGSDVILNRCVVQKTPK